MTFSQFIQKILLNVCVFEGKILNHQELSDDRRGRSLLCGGVSFSAQTQTVVLVLVLARTGLHQQNRRSVTAPQKPLRSAAPARLQDGSALD